MHKIARKYCLNSLRPYPYGYMPRGMAWGWFQPDLIIQSVIHIDKHSPTSLDNGQYILLIGPILGIDSSQLCSFKLAARYNVAGIWKCWYPTPVQQLCIPAGMVQMKVGAQNIVDLFWTNPRVLQLL